LNGAARSVDTGIEQLLADLIRELVSASQSERSFKKAPVYVLITTLYPSS
jgi:hypothetical protein